MSNETNHLTDGINPSVRPASLIIRPPTGWAPLDLKELWHYRELALFLTWRDLQVRYKQTLLGVVWAVLQPFMKMVVFTIFFGKMAHVSSGTVPYPIFTLIALLPWQLFERALTDASNSMVMNQNIITKVYFPRLMIPLASILAGLVDFCMALIMLACMMAYYRVVPSVTAVALPLLTILAVITALGAGLWLSALNVRYRDVRFAMPFLTQLWFFATPVVYESSLGWKRFGIWYGLNPMVGVVDGFRTVLCGGSSSETVPMMIVSTTVAILMLISGLYYFRKAEATFADTV